MGEPSADEGDEEHRRKEAAAEIVEDQPAFEQPQGIVGFAAAGGRNDGQKPGQDLPVAANPALAAIDIGDEAGGMVLDQLDIVDEAAAGEAAFDQVVAEDGIVGKAHSDGGLESAQVIDPLADEGAFGKKIVVDVGDFAGVGIDADLAGVQAGILRAGGSLEADGDARLEDAVAFDNVMVSGIDHSTVQRVGERPHEMPGGAGGQLSVSIERDDIAQVAQARQIADDRIEVAAIGGEQQAIEILKFAAFALVAHPAALAGIPAARAMQEEEKVSGCGGIGGVEFLNPGGGGLEQFLIAGGGGLLVGIGPIGQESEAEIGIAVGQMMDLQRFEKAFHAIEGT